MRTSLRIVIGISVAILMAGVGVVVVESRGAVSNELRAVFADATGDRIISDDGRAYVSTDPRHRYDAVAFSPDLGSIVISVGVTSPAARFLNLDFMEMDMLDDYRISEPGGDGYDCRDYFNKQMNVPEFPMPPIALPGSADTTSFVIQTWAKVTYTNGKWQSTGTTFNVRDMPVRDTVYVGFNFSFKTAGRTFWLAFNEKHWGGLDLRLAPGFAQVTRTDENTWLLRPIDPATAPALPNGTEENFANLFVYVPEVKRVHGAGYCDLGNWRMPFSITLTRY